MLFVVLIENILNNVLQKREYLSIESTNFEDAKNQFFDWTKQKNIGTLNLSEDEEILEGEFDLGPQNEKDNVRKVKFYLENSTLNKLM